MEFIQMYNYVIFSVYTKTSTPQAHIHYFPNDTLRLKVNWFNGIIKLGGPVTWPARASIDEYGYMRLRFNKLDNSNWTKPFEPVIGHPTTMSTVPTDYETILVENQQLNYDTCLLSVAYKEDLYNYIGVGQHIFVTRKIDGILKKVPYTPVPLFPLKSLDNPNPAPGSWFLTNKTTHLLVKTYPLGKMSKWLCNRTIGDEITISNPRGTFDHILLKNMTELIMIAGGTGITPLLSLTLWVLQTKRNIDMKLYVFNRYEKNIVWRKELDNLAEQNDNFKIQYTLSRPGEHWKGWKGRINMNMLRGIAKPYLTNRTDHTFFAICGQVYFSIQIARNLTKQLHYPEHQVYRFHGQ